ncbi:MAG TPA: RDD family protein [Acidimicrobiales bacterium]|nr:RDD family protein [Acidimicrobiales bacterium]
MSAGPVAVVAVVEPEPEPAVAPVAYAGAVSRLAAYVVDLAAMSALLTAGSAVVVYLVAVVTGHQLELSSDRDLAGAGLALWWVVYFAGSWATTGRTPGMALFGLRVVRPDGTRASATAALVRAVTFPLSLLLFGLGFLGILFHAQRRALHDLLAGTAVVYAFGPPAPRPLPELPPPPSPAV